MKTSDFPIHSIRDMQAGDGGAVVALWKTILPPDMVINDLADQIDDLLGSGSAQGSVILTEDGRCAAFGLSGFVTDEIADAFLEKPEPYLALRLLAQHKRGKTVFLDVDEQAKRNLGDGLTLFILDYVQETFDFEDPWAQHLLNTIVPEYHRSHSGFNIKRSFHETDAKVGHIQVAGGNQKIKDVSPQHAYSMSACGQGPRSVYGVSRGDNALAATAIAKVLLHYIPPTLKLVPREQQIVKLAIQGLTDTAIAERLGISRDGVRQRWSAIFDHVEDTLPDFYGEGDATPVGATRGAEKRRRTLSYLSARPSELRPHYLKR